MGTSVLAWHNPYLDYLLASCVLVIVVASSGCGQKETVWRYKFQDINGVATLHFVTSDVFIVYEGISLDTVSASGTLRVSGRGWGSQIGRYGDTTFNRSYRGGVASVEIDGRTVSIRDRGTIIRVDGKDYPIPRQGQLIITLDSKGRVVSSKVDPIVKTTKSAN